MPEHRIFSTKFSSVYPLYVQKAERKGRTKAEVDRVILWLTGYSEAQFQQQLQRETDGDVPPAVGTGGGVIHLTRPSSQAR